MAKYIHVTDEKGRVWRKYTKPGLSKYMLERGQQEPILKNRASVYEAYGKGFHKEVISLEMSLRICLSALNALYQNHSWCFYKDIHSIFGDNYVFTKEDLATKDTETGPNYAILNLKYHLVEFKYTCIGTVLLSIVSKCFFDKPQRKDFYRNLSQKYFIDSGVNTFESNKRKEYNKSQRAKYDKWVKSMKRRSAKLIYTPMGNKR